MGCGPISGLYSNNWNGPGFQTNTPNGNSSGSQYKGMGVTTPVAQITPNDIDCDAGRLQAFSAGGVQVGLGDGSVRNVGPGVGQSSWGRAVEPADGLPFNSDW